MNSDRSDPSPARTDDPVDWERLGTFMQRMLVSLDGLWFLNVLKECGDEKAVELDIRVMISQFKKATRVWRELNGLDGKSVEDKKSVFSAMARMYGHDFEVFAAPGGVTMRLKRCAFLDAIRKVGRDDVHDCRILCNKLAPAWFAEIEPRTGGAGRVELTLPQGGDRCDWTVDTHSV